MKGVGLMDNTLIARKIMNGCFLVTTGENDEHSILLGCPSEILKVFLKNGQTFPNIIVLPSDFYRKGIIQADLEFPLYYFLFVQIVDLFLRRFGINSCCIKKNVVTAIGNGRSRWNRYSISLNCE